MEMPVKVIPMSVTKLKRRMLVYSIIGVSILIFVVSVFLAVFYIGKYNAIKECCKPNIITCIDK